MGAVPRALTIVTRSMQGKEKEVYDATLSVLYAAASGDWATYASLVDEDITCFETESMGSGYKSYFVLALVDVNIRMLGETGKP
ncbi:hypothetical protein T484DRAFT_1851214 [Baffinella frigidus]|nr:hypothetical protein T484DRAFT_1851214 [Cryptophyta sp. CCMP2293]